MTTRADLVGTWRLVSYHDVGARGERAEGPLGPAPAGVLIYHPQGGVSVSMMRTPETGTSGAEGEQFMGYAGEWHLDGDSVVHRVVVSSHDRMVGTEQVREISWQHGDLVLRGSAVIDGVPKHRELTWRRN
jgi:hypothetical protein